MSDNHPNYREAYFQHPTLTKISSDPTYMSLAKLEREIKANGKSVPSTLKGGSQGHLGLVSSAQSYDRISPGVLFARLALPDLPDLSNSTQEQIRVPKNSMPKPCSHSNSATSSNTPLSSRSTLLSIQTASPISSMTKQASLRAQFPSSRGNCSRPMEPSLPRV